MKMLLKIRYIHGVLFLLLAGCFATNEGYAESSATATLTAATSSVAPATTTNATEEEIIKKVADKFAEALKQVAKHPESATAQVAPATVEKATKDSAILKVSDKIAEGLVTGISNTIDVTRKSTVKFLGGPESSIANFVDQILSLIVYDFWGWPFWEYLLSFMILFVSLVFRQWIAEGIFKSFLGYAKRTKTKIDDELAVLFENLLPPFRMAIALVGIYLSISVFFRYHPHLEEYSQAFNFFRAICFLFLLVNIAWALCRIADVAIFWLSKLTREQEVLLDHTFIPIARRTFKIFIMIITVLQGLAYFNLDTIVNSLMAAAGVSGLAIGLAAQDTIKNFFGSIVLLIDRPFSIGDWIVTGETEGIVESVGFRSTKIRTFGKTLITIPNSSIVDRDIDNISRRRVRRIKFYLGVSYSTKPAQMEELLRRIRELLQSDEEVWPKLILVRFTEFGESSLNVFIYYFTKTTEWDEHLAIRERINLEIMKIVDDLGLEIAYPTRTLYLRQDQPPERNFLQELSSDETPDDTQQASS